jgi:glycosyltransferase involved in cell wall biosynthesis
VSSGLHVGIDARTLGRRGVGRYLKNLVAALAEVAPGWRFTLFLGPKSDRAALPPNANVASVSLAGHPALLEQRLIPRRARQMGCDLLHAPDNTGPLWAGLPLVLTLHDTLWLRPLCEAVPRPTMSQRLQDRYRKWVAPPAARRARRVLTVSEFSRRDILARLGLEPGRVLAAPLGADPVFARPLAAQAAAALRRKLGVQGPYILAQGASDTRKNTDRLIQAVGLATRQGGRLAKASLVLTSLRPGEIETTRYPRSISEAGLQGRVLSVGYVGDAELKALYQGALAFAFPSLAEGFGLPVLEAFSLGCPVLASDRGSLPEVAGKAALVADPEDPVALAAGLSALAAPGARARYAALGRARLSRFSWGACARATLRAYEQAAQAS